MSGARIPIRLKKRIGGTGILAVLALPGLAGAFWGGAVGILISVVFVAIIVAVAYVVQMAFASGGMSDRNTSWLVGVAIVAGVVFSGIAMLGAALGAVFGPEARIWP
ncbi:hypothetical protein [Maliponia aquimaris]|uniref:Uncharacterized protein n=1 Tax=Maliponia aquimaris TaxID=1673631 RepID=A0A238K1J2_9RHOB|nr:hypothetical protein [Maliponia aquimaris]SMX36643.1 hypothetical protein MAA8898_00943 [Maliponia aquimaris]